MDENQIQECQDAFAIFDSVGDGMIAVKQVGEALRAMGQNPTEADIQKCVESLDPNGRITWDVFFPILQTIMKTKNRFTYDEVVEGLRHFDDEGDGFIHAIQLRQMLTGLGEKMTDDEVEQLMEGFADDDGKINYEMFIKQIMNG
ncbi:hypothetical protein RDWZM_001774 [Blomia tropicalis]|uniref:EF-hand domain-containing protein n=1 Tax=Blomia tropicalis TaxID=40697 RepID=A0A9Q0MCK0_BLOTA|nr:hypothetical protein RDWZM_001774 [Blomia tropicalis]